MLGFLVLMSFPVALTFAAANDLFTMKIPNRISLILIVGFPTAAILAGFSPETIAIHAGVALLVLCGTFALFAMNMLGGGDAKLMAAAALWMGVEHALEFVIMVTFFGGVLAIVMLAYRKYVPAEALPGWAQRLHVDGSGIPYGIAIAAAGLRVFPMTDLFARLAV